VLEHSEVGARVAHVVEPLLAKGCAQALALMPSLEVLVSVAGKYLIEQAQMLGHTIRDLTIGCSGEHQAAPTRFDVAQTGDEQFAVGQGGRAQRHVLGERLLEAGTPGQQPEG
jgi:hypothetical protein